MAVYFIRAGDNGPVKIGTSEDADRRLRNLQMSHWSELRLIRQIPGSFIEERWLHWYFAINHLRSEWFVYCPQMLTIVPTVNDGNIEAHPLAKYRSSRGWSIDDCAAAFGVSSSAICRYESRERFPGARTMMRIAATTNNELTRLSFISEAA